MSETNNTGGGSGVIGLFVGIVCMYIALYHGQFLTYAHSYISPLEGLAASSCGRQLCTGRSCGSSWVSFSSWWSS